MKKNKKIIIGISIFAIVIIFLWANGWKINPSPQVVAMHLLDKTAKTVTFQIDLQEYEGGPISRRSYASYENKKTKPVFKENGDVEITFLKSELNNDLVLHYYYFIKVYNREQYGFLRYDHEDQVFVQEFKD